MKFKGIWSIFSAGNNGWFVCWVGKHKPTLYLGSQIEVRIVIWPHDKLISKPLHATFGKELAE